MIDSNTVGRIAIDSESYKITSQNNIFNGASTSVYDVKCSANECVLISRNNYNENNVRMLTLSSKTPLLDVSNIEIHSIDDMYASRMHKVTTEYIAKDSNLTNDIFTKCFIKTSQDFKRVTWYEKGFPLFNIQRPHGTITHNKTTGENYIHIIVDGVEKIIQL